jgi:Skp family chaperone for outer membrane proteins
MLTILAVILLAECIILFLAIVIAAAVVKDAIVKLEETKQYVEFKKAELEDFINEKQAFVQKLEDNVKNSRLGGLLGL